MVLPICYLFLTTRFPETPQQLLRWGREEDAKRSLKFYCNCDGSAPSKEAEQAYQKEFEEMREAIIQKAKDDDNEGLTMADFCKLPAMDT